MNNILQRVIVKFTGLVFWTLMAQAMKLPKTLNDINHTGGITNMAHGVIII